MVCKNNSLFPFLIISFVIGLVFSFSAFSQENSNFEKELRQVINVRYLSSHKLDSIFFRFKNDTIKMKILYNKSVENNYLSGQSYALNMIGIVYRNISKYDKSTNYHLEGLNLAKNDNNTELQVVSYNMLGVVYRRRNLIRAALDYHKQALDLAESVNPLTIGLEQSIAVSLNSLGNIYLALRQYDLALDMFKKSLSIEQKYVNKLGLAINYQNIGYALEAKGNLDDALKNYQISLDYNNQIDSEIGRVICYNSIAQINIKEENYDLALDLLENALNKAIEIGDKFYVATTYNNLGWAQLSVDKLSEAEDNLLKGLATAQEFDLSSDEIEAYLHLSELYTKKQDYKQAFEYYKKSEDLDKTITSERNIQYVNDLIMKYESEKKNSRIKELANDNEIMTLKLEENRKMYFVGLGGLLLLIIILYILYRQSKLKDEKKIITLEQDMLRNQMNPHFIFNSLNSIKLYIINNEKENAVYYLNKFSKLMRKILVASTEKEITLEEELETMELYINIENMRFSNQIKYSSKVNPEIDPSLIKVPSLILQPFLENALWHGLSSKDGKKNIDLEVEKNATDFVTVKITDNGVGREASRKIETTKSLNKKSVGISLTMERLANFSKNFSSSYRLNINDLKDEHNNPCGTQVVIDIPIDQIRLRTA